MFVFLLFLIPHLAKAEITADHLVISEVQTSQGAGLTTNDFVEIYNPTDNDIDLNGYRLVKRTKTGTSDTTIKSWTSSTVIPARTYYLWVNSSYSDLTGDVVTSQTLADNNAVAIRFGAEDTGDIIDAVAWGENQSTLVEGSVFVDNVPDNQSIERTVDTQNNASDFRINTTPSPRGLLAGPVIVTPPPAPDPAPAPTIGLPPASDTQSAVNLEISITEILPDPEGTDSGQEWAELHNLGYFEVDVSGWILDEGSTFLPSTKAFALPIGSIIPANGYIAVLIPKGTISLNNTGDSARLFSKTGVLEDAVNYPEAVECKAWAKNGNGWVWSMPTPGQVNLESDPDTKDNTAEDQYKNYTVVFNEIFGNPKGGDESGEWVELFNRSDADLDLTGWYLDDAGKTVSANAYLFPTGSIVPAKGVLLIKLSEDDFSITNTGDEIRLLSPDEVERAKVILPKISDNESFTRVEADKEVWELSKFSTPGKDNNLVSPPRRVRFSEISFGEDGFVEIYNEENEWVNLGGWRLIMREESYVFPDQASVAPKFHLVLGFGILGFRVQVKDINDLEILRPDGEAQDSLLGRQWNGDLALKKSLIIDDGTLAESEATPRQDNKAVVKREPEPKAALVPAIRPLTPIIAVSKQASLVAGESDIKIKNSETNLANKQELPIIIEKNPKKGFFHKIMRIFCLWPFDLLDYC